LKLGEPKKGVVKQISCHSVVLFLIAYTHDKWQSAEEEGYNSSWGFWQKPQSKEV